MTQRSAHDAVEQGRAALRAGNRPEALRWLDRAHRLAPRDRSVALLLASAFTGVDDTHARALLRGLVAAAPEMRDARVALVLAERRLGAAEEAARQLGRLLLAMAPPPGDAFARLAGDVARAAAAPGWIGADSRGRLLVCAHSIVGKAVPPAPDRVRAGRVELAVDGLPAGVVAADDTPRVKMLAPGRVGVVTATCGGRALLGSGIDLAAVRRTRGAAWLAADGSLAGWAWLPGDPDRAPVLAVHVRDGAGGTRVIRPRATAEHGDGDGAERRRGFRVAARLLAGADTIRVAGADGTELVGSPLAAGPERRAGPWMPAGGAIPGAGARGGVAASARAVPARRAVDVVMPVHRGEADFAACLASLLRDRASGSCPPDGRIVVVDDASPDPALRGALAAAAGRGDIVLLRHAGNRGFPAAANTGLRHATGDGPRDIVLLNPDTLPPPGWLGRLAAAAYGAADIGSATPMTDDGSILSYAAGDAANAGDADRPGAGPAGEVARVERLDALFRAANGAGTVALPTGVGFCMLLRHDCLAEAGLLREDVFAQGYGEENDWCLRAGQLGWRHVAATGVFVAHRGGRSFGAARVPLMARNMALLNRLHPGYDALVARFEAADPLAPARRRVDRLRWAAGRRAGAVVLVTHGLGGGVERHLRERVAAIRGDGLRAVVLRPAAPGQARATTPGDPAGAGADTRRADPDRARGSGSRKEAARHDAATPWADGGAACSVSDGVDDRFADLDFAMPAGMAALARLLGGDRVRRVELHHLLGHAPEVAGLASLLGVPCDVVVHDYAAWCPRVSLCGADRRYCGEPVDELVCEDCVADLGSRLHERIAVAALRERSGRMLRAARRVVAPSADTAQRIARQFPGVAAVVAPWEDAAGPPHAADPGREDGTQVCAQGGAAVGAPMGVGGVRVLVMGAIGVEKGYDVLLGCVRDAGRRGLPLSFVVAGHTMDDARLLDAGPAFVTGRYEEHEAAALARRQRAQLGFVPSVWPETWCYALSELWRAGLQVAAFALGAQAERIRRAGHGLLLPPGLPAARVNDALLRAALDAGHAPRQMAGSG